MNSLLALLKVNSLTEATILRDNPIECQKLDLRHCESTKSTFLANDHFTTAKLEQRECVHASNQIPSLNRLRIQAGADNSEDV
jgi:hypothetical protein